MRSRRRNWSGPTRSTKEEPGEAIRARLGAWRAATERRHVNNRPTHEQLTARDDKGEQHVVMVTRSPIPGSPHLKGPPHYGQALHLVDPRAGILECVVTGQRLKIEAWRG